jgi:S-adenosyl methyltransferase
MPENLDWTTRGLDYEPPVIDTSKAHAARVYDYLLGGKDNYPPDRELAEQMTKAMPSVPVTARQNRLFMQRLARYLAAEEGIDQFLDIGTGIPTSPNLHEIVQQVNPAARVVYLDNDPIVLAHAHARLVSAPEGRVAYLHADMRDTKSVLAKPELSATLDLARPVALSILSTLHFVPDEDAYKLVSRYMQALPPGSFLALSTATPDFNPETASSTVSVLSTHSIPVRWRTKTEITAFFDGLELLEPGVIQVHHWRPDAAADEALDAGVTMYCGLARKA